MTNNLFSCSKRRINLIYICSNNSKSHFIFNNINPFNNIKPFNNLSRYFSARGLKTMSQISYLSGSYREFPICPSFPRLRSSHSNNNSQNRNVNARSSNSCHCSNPSSNKNNNSHGTRLTNTTVRSNPSSRTMVRVKTAAKTSSLLTSLNCRMGRNQMSRRRLLLYSPPFLLDIKTQLRILQTRIL